MPSLVGGAVVSMLQARLPGSGPAAGCGALPAPRVTVYDEHAEQQQQQQYGMLVRIQLPEGATIRSDSRERMRSLTS